MNMRRFCVFLNLLFLLSLNGCGQGFQTISPGSFVLLPWPDILGEYHFSWVQLKTLASPQKVSGPMAEVYWQQGNKDGGFSGQPARPHLVRQGRNWLTTDVPSMQALSVYALFERLFAFDQAMRINKRLIWPRRIGIDISIKTKNGSLLNNAIYDLDRDVIAVSRYDHDAAGLPTAVNHGILAHEHFHAHFAAAFENKRNSLNSIVRANSEIGLINRFILSGWNEGLADFYAYVYTRDPQFMRLSFNDNTSLRSLLGPLMPLEEWQSLRRLVNCDPNCRPQSGLSGLAYTNGTILARWLYRWSMRLSPQQGPALLLQEIMSQLPTILKSVNEKLDREPLRNSYFIKYFLQQQSLPLPPESCAELNTELLQIEPVAFLRGCP